MGSGGASWGPTGLPMGWDEYPMVLPIGWDVHHMVLPMGWDKYPMGHHMRPPMRHNWGPGDQISIPHGAHGVSHRALWVRICAPPFGPTEWDKYPMGHDRVG